MDITSVSGLLVKVEAYSCFWVSGWFYFSLYRFPVSIWRFYPDLFLDWFFAFFEFESILFNFFYRVLMLTVFWLAPTFDDLFDFCGILTPIPDEKM